MNKKKVTELVHGELQLRKTNLELKKLKTKYTALVKEYCRLEATHSSVADIKGANVETYVIAPRLASKDNEAVAVACLSDVHCEEIVNPDRVNGLNKYNPEIARQRVNTFFQATIRLVRKERQDIDIKTVLLWLGGDFFSSNLHDELPAICAMPPSEAVMYSQSMIVSGIEFLLNSEKNLNIHVVCSVGNHSRITPKVYVATEYGHSLEWIMYHNVEAYFRNEKRVRFTIEKNTETYVHVLNSKIRFLHGHVGLRYGGGVGGLTIPLRKAIDQKWQKQVSADFTVLGHYHRRQPSDDFLVNGSVIGDSAYGLSVGGHQEPLQSFFLVDKKRGITMNTPIFMR